MLLSIEETFGLISDSLFIFESIFLLFAWELKYRLVPTDGRKIATKSDTHWAGKKKKI